jgi:hypothetical protein
MHVLLHFQLYDHLKEHKYVNHFLLTSERSYTPFYFDPKDVSWAMYLPPPPTAWNLGTVSVISWRLRNIPGYPAFGDGTKARPTTV